MTTFRTTVSCGLLSLALTAGAARGTTLVRGPYLQQPTTAGVIVVFDLDEAAVAEVRVGPQGSSLDQVFTSTAADTHHELSVTELDADTIYSYGVFVDGTALSESNHLTTAVEPGEPFTFVVYGDSRSDHDAHEAVVAAMAGEEDARFVVHTGDLVSDGEDAVDWDWFFQITAATMAQRPLFPVVGNHDEDGGAADLLDAAFALPGDELYYSFDYGGAHFVILDQYVNMVLACAQDEVLVDHCLDEEQLAWLEQDLQAASQTADLIFVCAHEGPYSSKSGRSGSLQMRVLLPMFDQYGVTAIISGHDHYYERGFTDGGIPYVISGGGGAGLYSVGDPSDDPHTVAANESTYHYVVVEVTGQLVRFQAKNTEGGVIDEVVIDTSVPPEETGDDDTVPPSQGLEDGGGGCGCRLETGALGGAVGLALLALWLVRSRSRRD